MEGKNQPKSLGNRLTEGAPLAVWLVVVLLIIYQLISVLGLIAIALLLSLLLQTLLHQLEKVIRQPWLAVLIMVILILGLSILLPAVILPDLIDEFQKLSSNLPDYLNSLTQQSKNLHADYSFVPDLSQQINKLNDFLDGLLRKFPVLLEQVFGATVEAFATIILALYLTYYPSFLSDSLLRLTPRKYHQRIRHLFQVMKRRLKGWMIGTSIAMLFLGICVGIGLWILNIPLALSFAIIAGLLEIIPLIGSIVGCFLPALVALTISPLKFILVLGLFLLLNQIDTHLLQPIVVGKQADVHPVAVIITVLILGELLGLIGVILAVPAAVVAVALLDKFTPASKAIESASTSSK